MQPIVTSFCMSTDELIGYDEPLDKGLDLFQTYIKLPCLLFTSTISGVQESEDSLTTIIQSSSSLQLSTDVTTATADTPPHDSGTSLTTIIQSSSSLQYIN
mgnify:CR=1 FL=1